MGLRMRRERNRQHKERTRGSWAIKPITKCSSNNNEWHNVHGDGDRSRSNDVFVKLKVYEALNGQQQSKVAKKEGRA